MKLRPNYKYLFVKKINLKNSLVLEVGIGNNSPKIFKHYYPDTIYHGLDKDLSYNLDQESIRLIDKFYKLNLEEDSLNIIDNDIYDFVIIAHVIEHIMNGETVINDLSKKIKSTGYFYIEYPTKNSKYFPSMKGTLNFFDDATHKRFYNISDIISILQANGFKIVRSGVKRDFLRILGIPYMIIKSLITLGYVRGSVFWDILGFAEYILAQKIEA